MKKKLEKLFRRLFRIVWCLVELVLACIIVAVSLILYELHTSPMDGRFLLPELEKYVLPPDSGYQIQSDSVVISSDWQRPGLIQIDIENMQVLRPDETVEMALPKAMLSYDLWHILTLNYMPSMILLKEPYAHLILSDKGISVQTKPDEKPHPMDLDWGKRLVKHMLAFRRISIEDAQLIIDDLTHKRTFKFSDGDLKFHRHLHWTQEMNFNTQVQSEGIDTRLILSAELNRLTKNLSFQAGIPSINLSTLGHLLPVLKGVNFDTQISLKGDFDVAGKLAFVPDIVQKIHFNIQSLGTGTLDLPEPLTNIYPIESLNINGVVGQGCHMVKIASSSVALSYGTTASLDVDVVGVNEFLKTGDLNHIQTILKSTVQNVPTEKIGAVWPRGVGTSSHDWVAQSLTNGSAKTADFTLYFKGDEITDLYGDIVVQGITVDYLPPMPKVDGLFGHVYLYPDKVHIVPESGHIGHLKLISGDLLLTDVDIDPSWANIKLKISGPVSEALELLDSPPLEFVSAYGINPQKSVGTAEVETELFFRLDTDITPEEVKVSANADIKKASIALKTPDLSFTNADLLLDVKDNVLNVSGQADLFNVPLHLKWTEYFFPTNKIAALYDISTTISSDDLLKKYPLLENWFHGKLGLHLTAQRQQITDLMSGQLLVDAMDANLHSYALNYTKKEEQPLTIDIHFQDADIDTGKAQLNLYGKGPQKDLLLLGEINWGKDFILDFKKVQIGQNDYTIYFKQDDQNNILKLKGLSMDLSGVFNLPAGLSMDDSEPDSKIRNINADIHLDQVIFDPKRPIHNFVIQAQKQSQLWQSFHAQADLSTPFILIYDQDKRQFQGSFSDFGDLMDYLNLSNRFDGGKMSFIANQDKKGILTGQLQIDQFQLKDPGFVMQALTILGLVDAFLGKDIVFDEMQIPFVLNPNNDLKISDGYMAGTSLGITFEGEIKSGKINLSGSVVPAYGINSLPGKIPLIGFLFRKSEGGGLISVPYSIKGNIFSPETEFHPLGTITPGVLSNIF